ncbi:transcriptional regulator [Sporomusaceae bacterium FL31]|nr:transcriptional regulator [Sporomusaceae bacterium FL31]GCE35006.1 transcriptional regulator [Sporomusaceae bacterium]
MQNRKMPHDHGHHIAKALDQMPDAERFAEAASAFQQLSDSSRLRILWLLCHCEECVSNIAVAVNMSDPAVSHHLRNLKQHGLISSKRIGKEVHYTLSDNKKAHLIHQMIDDLFVLCCPNEK